MSESSETDAPSLSALFICFLNFVLHCVVKTVNRVYADMVPTVSAANSGPHLYASTPPTRLTSSAVGNTLKTREEKTKLIPRVPRSTARLSAPVCLERWYAMSSWCRCSKTWPETRFRILCATLAKMAFLYSLQNEAVALTTPYEASMTAGVATPAPRRASSEGPRAEAAPAISEGGDTSARRSTASLNRKGTWMFNSLPAVSRPREARTLFRVSRSSLGQTYVPR
mmetsp:Transcript_7047/g.21142  ORF Transcript_7047/g.21142 Transcript_7047/m.21142 type:complete len:226 (-) Transcript_7047:443-1120(-)